MKQSHMHSWSRGSHEFVRLDLAASDHVDIKKAFRDDISIIAFTGSVWESCQNSQKYIELPANIIVRDAGQVFSTKMLQVSPTGSTCRELRISPAKLNQIYDQFDESIAPIDFQSPVLESPDAHAIFWRLHRISERNECELEISTAMFQLLYHLGGRNKERRLRSRRDTSSRKIGLIVEYIRGNYSRSLSLSELASVAGCNPFVLQRQFRQELGATPHEYLAAHRVNEAKSLLKQGLSISEISYVCGFSDQSHLTRNFKRHFGITPGRFISETDL